MSLLALFSITLATRKNQYMSNSFTAKNILSLLLFVGFSQMLFAQSKTALVQNNVSNRYEVLINTDSEGKQSVSLKDTEENNTYKLDRVFSEFTNIKSFVLLEHKEVPLIHFRASDLRYEVSYYWQYNSGKLFFIAKDFRDNKIFKSESLKKTVLYKEFVEEHYTNPASSSSPSKTVAKDEPVEKKIVQEVMEEVIPNAEVKKIEEEVDTPKKPAVPSSWGSTSNRDNLSAGQIAEEILDLKENPGNNYRAVLYNNAGSKKELGFGKRNEDLAYEVSRLPQKFSRSTILAGFTVLSSADMEIFHFSANDFDWLVNYYYDNNTGELHFIAKGNQSGKIIRSDGLKRYSSVTRFINKHFDDELSASMTKSSGGTKGTKPSGKLNISNSKNLALKIGEHLNRSRIFNLSMENSTNQFITIEEPKVTLIIKGAGGFYLEHDVMEMKSFKMEGFDFVTILDNFITEGASGQYLIYKDFEENLTFLPPLRKGRYQIQALVHSNGSGVRSNVVTVQVPIP